jgi:penicillin-binding protein 1A
MASAYATLAAGGVYSRPTAIRRVVLPDGRVDATVAWGTPKRKRVFSDGVAWEVSQILEENVRYGTGTRARLSDRPVAGKTGTTDEHADAWFVGYTPNVSTAVWMGYTRGEIPMESVHGIAVSGGSFPAEIWHSFMEAALAGTPPVEFPEEPDEPVEWQPFQRGPYALSFDPNETTSTERTDTSPTRTTAPPRDSGSP